VLTVNHGFTYSGRWRQSRCHRVWRDWWLCRKRLSSRSTVWSSPRQCR